MGTMKKNIIFLTILLLAVSFVSAVQPSQQFNKIFLQPFYRASMSSATNYTYTLPVSAPDGISGVVNAIITFNGQINGQTQTFTLFVNGKACNNPTYSVATAFSTTGNVQFSFDCSNVITQAGTYNLNFISAVNTGAMNGWLDLTYMNNPKGLLTIHGTEYVIGQTAKLWLQLLNSSGNYINNGVCYLDIYTPSNNDYILHATMNNMNKNGVYYYDLPAPLIEGVYPALATCYYQASQQKSTATQYTILNGVLKSGLLSDTYSTDLAYHVITTDKNGGLSTINRINVSYQNFNNFYQSCGSVSEALVTGVTFYWDGVWNTGTSGHNIYTSVFNYTGNKWIELPNNIVGGLGGATQVISNSLSVNNVTKALGLSATNLLKVRFYDNSINEGAKDFKTDYLYASCDQLANPTYQEVKGSSEMHVSLGLGQNTQYFYVTTLCPDSQSNSCAEFKHNMSYWNYTWGYIEDDLTIVNNQQTQINATYTYETQLGQDCTAIIDVTIDGNSELSETTKQVGTKENCLITFPVNLYPTQLQRNVVITQDNYMKWEVQRDKDIINYFELVITPLCNQIASAQNRNFTIPIETNGEQNISELYATQPLFLACYRAMDDLYWFNYYYDVSKSITTSGEYESYLLEARYYYPEIREESQIVQAISQNPLNLLFTITTLCGNSENTCAIANPPDGYFSSQEGYVVENMTIINKFNSQLTVDYKYELPMDTDCTSILDIYAVKNGVTIDKMNTSIFSVGTKANCIINIPIHFNEGEIGEQIYIKYQNYIHWNMFQMRDKVDAIRINTETFCNALALNNSITYNLPIVSGIEYLNNDNLEFCYRAMDDLYWWDFFITLHLQDTNNESIAVPNGLEQSTYSEFLYFYPYIIQSDNIIRQFQKNANQLLTLSMVTDIVNNTALRVWDYQNRTLTQNISSASSINTTQIAIDVWNANNRSLSNETQIAEKVWNWSGNISDNILTQIATKIWSFVGRYIQGETQ